MSPLRGRGLPLENLRWRPEKGDQEKETGKPREPEAPVSVGLVTPMGPPLHVSGGALGCMRSVPASRPIGMAGALHDVQSQNSFTVCPSPRDETFPVLRSFCFSSSRESGKSFRFHHVSMKPGFVISGCAETALVASASSSSQGTARDAAIPDVDRHLSIPERDLLQWFVSRQRGQARRRC